MPNNSPDLATLSEPDVRAIVRLLGEVAALQGDHAAKKRFLMDGLCALIDADFWVWGLASQFEPGKPPVYIGGTLGGFSEESIAKYLVAVEAPVTHRLTIEPITELHHKKNHLTRTLGQLSNQSQGHWNDWSDPGAVLWQDAGIGSVIVSFRSIEESSVSSVGIYRKFSSDAFSERDGRIAHIILSEVPWLHEMGWPDDRAVSVPKLSPRKRLILELLLQCCSRKQIASDLAITENTLSGYIKEIYRHFSVQSHPELLRKFYQGNGGDR
jgi:DNA-binding CsgD family transcriptional regulator